MKRMTVISQAPEKVDCGASGEVAFMAEKPDLRSPLARARDEWFESPEGQKCMEPSILLPTWDGARYLQNRLAAAFIAGASAQEKVSAMGETATLKYKPLPHELNCCCNPVIGRTYEVIVIKSNHKSIAKMILPKLEAISVRGTQDALERLTRKIGIKAMYRTRKHIDTNLTANTEKWIIEEVLK